jgi:hypothetical protein
MNLIRYLNMHRSRLGYVNCVLLVADIQLDSLVSLRRRLDGFLFRVISEDEATFADFRAFIDADGFADLTRMKRNRSKRKSKRSRKGIIPDYVELPGAQVGYAVSELWLYQSAMRSQLGHILEEDSDEPIELAKSLGFLSQGNALTEFGNAVKLVLLSRGDFAPARPLPNPLVIYDEVLLRLLYLMALLQADAAFIGLLQGLSSGANPDKALKAGLDYLIGRLETETRLDEVSEARGIFDLRRRIDKIHYSRDGTAEEPVAKAQGVPRLEFCVDLGFLERGGTLGGDAGMYQGTTYLERVPRALGGLIERPTAAARWLDREFFGAAGMLYGRSLTVLKDTDRRLMYFVKGARFLGRRQGFVPGRIASLVGCLLAWQDGFQLEISELFDEVYRVPKGQWADSIKFSGGSRLDNEFLVALAPDLEAKLEAALQRSGGS